MLDTIFIEHVPAHVMTENHGCVGRVIITLCAYAQQGYVFGRVGLCIYMYNYMCICGQKNGCLRSCYLKISHWRNLLLAHQV